MESTLKATVDELRQDFHKRMEAFEADLQKSSSTGTSTSGLAAEFISYRNFISQALALLQQQIETLAHAVDTMETQRRRKMLLFHGVAEASQENSALLVADLVRLRLCFADFQADDIQRCHRMGRTSSSKKPRPILVKLRDVNTRDKIWFSKTRLKNSGVTLSEFLTKTRHDVFMAAREKFGVTNCWTREGSVYVLGSGIRHRVASLSQLGNIPVEAHTGSIPVTKQAAPARSRRAAVSKK
ncbi:uncharacterized protein LOC119190862 [Manduca sexta]|uniref:uncharacterized protein LOC119190862 n=1 Tax=Manduca sexta TaxID=7130 RepID=UPI00188FC57D|nr:uncharacterized protein LOC119190862 [Manduca sexta]